MNKGFSILIVMIVVLIVGVLAWVGYMSIKTEPVQSLPEANVVEVSDSAEVGVIKSEIEETMIEFPESEFVEMEAEAATL